MSICFKDCSSDIKACRFSDSFLNANSIFCSSCLQNRYRKWTLDDLVAACSDALYEYEGIKKGISTRTVQLDIQNMRSEKLGYNAPIIVTDKKYYSYEDKKYSITNIPLSGSDLNTLSEVVQILRQFKGFGYFQELTGMVSKLEDKIYKQQNKGKSFIHFETNNLLKGLEYIDPLHKAIINKTPLEITYQSFRARQAGEIVFHPYLLKEYRNRWFLFGAKSQAKRNGFITIALDRIISVKESTKTEFIENDIFDAETFFDDAIGVTKSPNQSTLEVIMNICPEMAPYVITKPLHSSQKILKRDKDGMIFSINVIWNFELEREILGFGEHVKVLSPRLLVKQIKKRTQKMLEHYTPNQQTTPPDASGS